MSNFFAALDDSNHGPAPAPKKKAPKKEVVEPSKVEKRPVKNDRHTSDRHNPKGGRGQRAPARDGKRAYDRRSGTGRGREGKKEGGGGHNWGNDKNDAKKAEGPVTEGKEDVNAPEGVVKEEAAVVKEAVVEPEPEPEPEDVTISYEEYLSSKATPDSAAFKAIEVRDIENEFAGKSAAKKVSTNFLKMADDKALRKKGTGKAEKNTLVVDFKYKKPDTGGDDRGAGRERGADRGGERSGRGGGGDRRGGERSGRGGGDRGRREGGRREGGRGGGARSAGARASGKSLDTSDDSAFPSL